MQAHLFLTPPSISGGSGAGVSSLIKDNPKIHQQQRGGIHRHHLKRRHSGAPLAFAAINSSQNHYHVLGLSSTASPLDIKRAYRLLARKFHPDVSKDAQAGESFKKIRFAYEVLSNVETRAEYDRALHHDSGSQRTQNWTYDLEFEEGVRVYRWAELRRQMRREKYRKQYESTEDDSSSFGRTEEYDEDFYDSERGSFTEVLKFTFLALYFMQAIGSQFTLMVCSLTSLLDKKLDGGYKFGYLLAWILGGRRGTLLTLCLSFAIWACGKTSSSIVTLVAVAMWIGTNAACHAPIPQGALIALLYMSIKLQAELRKTQKCTLLHLNALGKEKDGIDYDVYSTSHHIS